MPKLVEGPNLSVAWAKAFRAVDAAPGKEIVGLSISFGGFSENIPLEDARIRGALDALLSETSPDNAIQTVANTIFPQHMWARANGNRQALYENYLRDLPRFVELAPARNRQGTYFSRLIADNINARTGAPAPHRPPMNQLEIIIAHCQPRRRRSYLQASIFDPARDHSEAAQQGFPCLQHLTFVPDFRRSVLTLNAFYASHQILDKAYGNFLGLARLGCFVASQVDLQFERVTCFAGIEKLDQPPPAAALARLRQTAQEVLNEIQP